MRPICVPCSRTMNAEKNGVCFTTIFSDGRRYQLWSGDKWKCPDCKAEIIVGVGQSPIAEHYERNFAEKCAALAPEIEVKL
jgi:hypothetical protein